MIVPLLFVLIGVLIYAEMKREAELLNRVSELEALLNKVGHAEFQDDHVTCAWIPRDTYDRIQSLKGGK